MPTIKDMVGKTPTKIYRDGDDFIQFWFSDGTTCTFLHYQDCCEDVHIEDVNGCWEDLLGTPLLVAEERVDDGGVGSYGDSCTWTFYCFRGLKGSVDVRWCGTSNGYYSESVDLHWGTW